MESSQISQGLFKKNTRGFSTLALVIFGGVIVASAVFVVSLRDKSTQQNESVLQTNNVNIEIASSTNSVATTSEYAVTEKVGSLVKKNASSKSLYEVIKVVDGDTLDVSIDGKVERLRLIGINTPETVDPRKPVECFGIEASSYAKTLLTGKKVSLEADPTQGELDKYGRLLRYVFLEDGTNFNLRMIQGGYAYEYTYDIPYKYQTQFKQAQKEAMSGKVGLWGDVCQTQTTTPPSNTAPIPTPTQTNSANSCSIKGNINSKKEKIYHMVGCGSYSQTIIDESKGEKWFCSEQEALEAGWRKALNCN